jgi:hypothetical protein
MTALYSKQVSDREKSSREVLAALDTHVRDAASRLDETLLPYAAPAAGGTSDEIRAFAPNLASTSDEIRAPLRHTQLSASPLTGESQR